MPGNPIPICPLMSAGNDISIVCVQEKCAWYVPNLKKCALYVLGHESMLEIKDKIASKEE